MIREELPGLVSPPLVVRNHPRIQALLPEIPEFLGSAQKHQVGDVIKVYNPRAKSYVVALVILVSSPKSPGLDGRKALIFLGQNEELYGYLGVASAQRMVRANWPKIGDKDFRMRLQRVLFEEVGLEPRPIGRADPTACLQVNKKLTLEPHQRIVAYTLGYGPYRGLLAIHSLGSGKTCTAIATVDEYLKARQARKGCDPQQAVGRCSSHPPVEDEPPVLFVIPPRDSLVENLKTQLASCPGFLRDQIDARKLEGPQRSRLINRYIQVVTYVSLANRVQRSPKALDGKLILLDEAHNLLYPEQTQYRKSYDVLYQALRRAKDSKILLMTATPIFRAMSDLTRLASLCRPPDAPLLPQSDKEFFQRYFDGESIKPELSTDLEGCISWFMQENDPSYFARKSAVPPKELVVSKEHYQRWTEAAKREKDVYKVSSLDDFGALETSPAFQEGLRRSYRASSEVANYPYRSFKGKGLWAPKFDALLEAVQSSPRQKHVVFSRHLESGVRAIASFLESKGWVRMSNNRSDKVTQPPKTYHPLGEQLEKVSMEDSAARADLFGKLPQKHRGFLVLTKDTPDREIKRARALFNDPLNREGRAASVLLLDDKFYEGVNLMHVQHVHLFEPIPNSQSERQAIARAIRRCSHAGQPWPWEVQIHRYFHVGPGGATDPMTDHYLQLFNNRMRKRFDQIQEAYVTASIEHGWVQSIQTLPSDVAEQVRKRLSLLERIKLALQRAFQLGVPRLVSSTPTKGP